MENERVKGSVLKLIVLKETETLMGKTTDIHTLYVQLVGGHKRAVVIKDNEDVEATKEKLVRCFRKLADGIENEVCKKELIIKCPECNTPIDICDYYQELVMHCPKCDIEYFYNKEGATE